ncbi:hypothetical protein [Bradyrhizobium sp. th.b2]|uniref:hypothetical protein n=1 Tax=Bradyrhizobium sp. th-b2 TaxID=172088 RepID=UPI000491A799|nr:hypothetical protein [Bradyrhizobium sp. th.b2]
MKEDWRFRAAVMSINQKTDASGRGKARRVVIDMLRSPNYRLTGDDQAVLADFLEQSWESRGPGRPAKRQLSEADKIVSEILALQAKERLKLKDAIKFYKVILMFRLGDKGEPGAKNYMPASARADELLQKHQVRIQQELNRSKASKKPSRLLSV